MPLGPHDFYTIPLPPAHLSIFFFLTKTHHDIPLYRFAQWNRSIRFGSLRCDLECQRQQRQCNPRILS